MGDSAGANLVLSLTDRLEKKGGDYNEDVRDMCHDRADAVLMK